MGTTSSQAGRPALRAGADPGEDHVVLLSDDGAAVGLAARAGVHGTVTPLHLGFSCYVYDEDGRVLLTRRALGKATWPGVWTNSFCGHPRLHESLPDAVARHAWHELGMTLTDVQCVLPDFRYRAVDPSGIVEHEICPVYTARALTAPLPHPEEVMDLTWVTPAALRWLARETPWALSPWTVLQVGADATSPDTSLTHATVGAR